MANRPGEVRKAQVVQKFDAFLRSYTNGLRGWEEATPDDIFDWLCYLDSQGQGTKVVHNRSCPGVGTDDESACDPGDPVCGKRYAAGTLDKSFVVKLRMEYRQSAHRGEDWDPIQRRGNPCGSPRVSSYLKYATETQKQVGVPIKQAAPILSHTVVELLESMRLRATVAEPAQAIVIVRDMALFALAFHTMRRGFDLSNALGSHVLRLPDSTGLILNFQFGKTLRSFADETVVVSPDTVTPSLCAFKAVTSYISAAYRVGWDLASGHLFPQVSSDGVRSCHSMSSRHMTAALQAHLRAAGLDDHYTMHSFRVGGSVSRSLKGTAMDEIMKMAGWRTTSVAEHYVGATTSLSSAESRLDTDALYAKVSAWSKSSDFRDSYAACSEKYLL